MKHNAISYASTFLAIFAGTGLTALANDHAVMTTSVGPVTGVITQLNYDENGATVNGLLIGMNVLLVFPKNVCGGTGTLGAVGNTVTYSGVAYMFSSGFQTVIVTSFKNGSITYPPPTTSTKPTAYPLTAGTITQLNYDPENGSIDGFLFTPTSGAKVFVDIGEVTATLMPSLKKGTAISVMGTLEAPGMCAATGTISEVDATSVTIGTTTYKTVGVH